MLRERDPLRVLAWVLLALLGVATLAAVLWLLRAVFVPVMLSLILAYCLAPVVGLLQRRRVPRAASAAGLLVLVLGAFVLFLALFIPALQEELQRFAARLPRYLADARGRLEPLLATWGLEVPASLDDVLRQFGEDVKALVPSLAKPLTSALRKALSSTISLVVGLTGAVMVPLFAFYFLRDWERIVAGARDLIPAEHREAVVSRLVRFDEVLGGFLRGQLTVGLILGVF